MKNFAKERETDQVLLNSSGFEQWNSWHRNFESPEQKKMNEVKPRF